MAALEVLALDEATPQIRAPGVGDTYHMPRSVTIPAITGTAGGSSYFTLSNGTTSFSSTTNLQWSSTAVSTGAADVTLSRAAASILALTGASSAGGALQMKEMTAPAAPSADLVRIYAEDNGAGKTRLMALFPTGAAQQIAIEP